MRVSLTRMRRACYILLCVSAPSAEAYEDVLSLLECDVLEAAGSPPRRLATYSLMNPERLPAAFPDTANEARPGRCNCCSHVVNE